MTNIILAGLATGALAVLLCTSSAGGWVRELLGRVHTRIDQFVNCCFCATWWISIAMLENFTLVEWAATVAVANITVLLIHMSLGSVEDTPEEEGRQIATSLRREMARNLDNGASTQGSGSGPPRSGDR